MKGILTLSLLVTLLFSVNSPSLEKGVASPEEMSKKLEQLEHELERLQAINEIQNLMGRYEYLHTVNNHKAIVELYSEKAPDVFVNIGVRGHWVGKGKEAARRAWGTFIDMDPNTPGNMPIHPITTPVIEVAKDGKTARGVWIGTGFVASKDAQTGEPKCSWEWDKYGVDFIKEDGKWKFWHFHVYRVFSIGWDDKWAEIFKTAKEPVIMPKYTDYNKPDGPSIDSYPYSLFTVQKLAPAPPEPYEKWDETNSYGMPVKK